jgi:hypothetical protein
VRYNYADHFTEFCTEGHANSDLARAPCQMRMQ